MSGTDKQILETLFGMRSGYVIDFSDRTMSDFFLEEFSIAIYDKKYDLDEITSKSKANRLRGIWLKEDEKTVGQIILSLVDYLETRLLIDNKEIPQHTKDLAKKAREIGARLLFSEIVHVLDPIHCTPSLLVRL